MSKAEHQSLFRFVGFENFIDIIQRKSLTFVHHDLWEDPYEGALFKLIKTKSGKEKVLKILQSIYPYPIIPHFATIELISKFSPCIHGQSWTKCPESDALWRIYSSNSMSIRIEITCKNIEKLNGVSINEIHYSDSYDLEQEIKNIVTEKSINIGKLLLQKRTAFKHEQEVRLLSELDCNYIDESKSEHEKNIFGNAIEELGKRGVLSSEEVFCNKQALNKNKMPPVKYVPFNSVANFIESVMVHPQAPKCFVETVEMYCKINKLKFSGQSLLYTFTYP